MILKKLTILLAVLSLAFFTGCSDDDDGGSGGGNEEVRPSTGGFLWKPVSESTGNLIVLFPNEFNGKHSGSSIHSGSPANDKNLIENGVFHTESHNGDRVHYRYSRPGGEYPANCYAYISLEDGSRVGYLIPNGSGRVE